MTHKILIVAPNWVGDAIMAQSLYQLLKEKHPDSIIDVLAPQALEPLHQLMPEIRNCIASPFGHGELNIKAVWQVARSLKHEKYHEAFILPNSLKSALIPWLAGVKKRVGFLGEMRYILLNHPRQLDKTALPTMAERFNALAFDKNTVPNCVPVPQPKLKPSKETGMTLVQDLGLSLEKPVLILCPGAAYGPAKRWPLSHFKAIAHTWAKQEGEVWVLGDKKDKTHADAIANSTDGVFSLAGKTSLAEACELMALGSVVVSNDSGLMHLAAALERPLIAIYGSSSPKFTPPLSKQVCIIEPSISCSPCFERTCRFGHYHCLMNTQPQQVLSAIHQLLGKSA